LHKNLVGVFANELGKFVVEFGDFVYEQSLFADGVGLNDVFFGVIAVEGGGTTAELVCVFLAILSLLLN